MPSAGFEIKKQLVYAGLIIIAVLVFYFPAFKNGILSWDDNLYITDNEMVKSISSIPYYFSHFDNTGNYMPFTLTTFTILYNFSGLSPVLYHFINILFHILNCLLVFYFIHKLLKNLNLAFITTLLFAVHPLHVESVAWIAELKDVQYTFFFLLSMIFYLKYVRLSKLKYLIFSLVFFISSALSKGQAVALFPVILLIDYFETGKPFTKLYNKIPYFLISLLFGIIAIMAQKTGNNISDYNTISFFGRTILASYAFTVYIAKTIFPFNLSAFYPYPELTDGAVPFQFWPFLLIIPLTIFILIYSYKKNKIIFFGFSFFISNIILLLQLIPVGNCIMADRYTYVASIGLNFVLAYYIIKLLQSKKNRLTIVSIFAIYLLVLGIFTHRQVTLWKDDFALWDNVLSNYPKIPTALVLRGCAFNDRKDFKKAITDFNNAIEIDKTYGLAYFNRAVAKSGLGDFQGSLPDFEAANRLKFEDRYLPNFYVSWGAALANTGNLNEALNIFNKAIEIAPNKASLYNNRGITKAMLGNINEALADFDYAIKLDPTFTDAVNNRNKALNSLQKR